MDEDALNLAEEATRENVESWCGTEDTRGFGDVDDSESEAVLSADLAIPDVEITPKCEEAVTKEEVIDWDGDEDVALTEESMFVLLDNTELDADTEDEDKETPLE